jgi:hypothetical protein
MGVNTQILNFYFKSDFDIVSLWNFLPVLYKQLLPNSSCFPDKRGQKRSLFPVYSLKTTTILSKLTYL